MSYWFTTVRMAATLRGGRRGEDARGVRKKRKKRKKGERGKERKGERRKEIKGQRGKKGKERLRHGGRKEEGIKLVRRHRNQNPPATLTRV